MFKGEGVKHATDNNNMEILNQVFAIVPIISNVVNIIVAIYP